MPIYCKPFKYSAIRFYYMVPIYCKPLLNIIHWLKYDASVPTGNKRKEKDEYFRIMYCIGQPLFTLSRNTSCSRLREIAKKKHTKNGFFGRPSGHFLKLSVWASCLNSHQHLSQAMAQGRNEDSKYGGPT